MQPVQVEDIVPADVEARARACPFATPEAIQRLNCRNAPYFFALQWGRHIGVHRQNERICNWTARVLTKDKLWIGMED